MVFHFRFCCLRSYWLWLSTLLFGSPISLMAQSDTLVLEGRPDAMALSVYFEALVDSQQTLSLAEAQEAARYVPMDSLTFPLELTQRLWARARVLNVSSQEQRVHFELGATDSAVVYVIGETDKQVVLTGNDVLPSKRSLPYGWTGGVMLRFSPGESMVYVMMQENRGKGPVFQPRWEGYTESMLHELMGMLPSAMWISLFCGGVIITLIYNLIVSISLRSRAYLYYSLYLLSILLAAYFAVTEELFPALGFPIARWNQFGEEVSLTGAFLFYLMFGRSFMDTAMQTPRWDYVLRVLIGARVLILLTFVIGLWVPSMLEALSMVSLGWFLVEMALILALLVRLALLRSTIVWFFIVGSLLVFGGGFGPILLNALLGILPNNGPYLLVSLSLEIVVFSLGLGYKVRQQQRAKLAAEHALNRELQKINTAFGRFVPHAFLESLGHESVLDVQLGDQVEKEVTVLFSDIRAYTSLAEGMTPQENFNFLNSYLGRMGPIIQAHRGFVNQYYGDGIMALFLYEPADAVQAAIEMQRELARYNAERITKHRRPVRIGIGIHTGPLMMGIIGDTLRLEAGVVADTVNTAARMEGLTKHFGITVLLSEATRRALTRGHPFQLRLLGRVQVKGRTQPLEVYHAYDGEVPEDQAQLAKLSPAFEEGLRAYLKGDFAQALRQLEALSQQLPEDHPTQHYLQRARRFLLEGAPEPWDGVEVMGIK